MSDQARKVGPSCRFASFLPRDTYVSVHDKRAHGDTETCTRMKRLDVFDLCLRVDFPRSRLLLPSPLTSIWVLQSLINYFLKSRTIPKQMPQPGCYKHGPSKKECPASFFDKIGMCGLSVAVAAALASARTLSFLSFGRCCCCCSSFCCCCRCSHRSSSRHSCRRKQAPLHARPRFRPPDQPPLPAAAGQMRISSGAASRQPTARRPRKSSGKVRARWGAL